MIKQDILSRVDHTLLKPDATFAQIKTLCDEAVSNKTASVCINSCFAQRAVDYLDGKLAVCAVVGFPLGAMSSNAKIFEAAQALKDGAAEIDMVVNIGAVKEGDFDYVAQEISEIKLLCKDRVLKVIIETCLLSQSEKEKMCEVVVDSGADYIKTSTGFSTAGATPEDIELFARCIKGRCKIKAAGGIKSVSDMENFINLGADRLGTSSAIKLFENEQVNGY